MGHRWLVEINGAACEVEGEAGGSSGVWHLSEEEFHQIPAEIRCAEFPDQRFDQIGLDGLTAEFGIETERGVIQKNIWSPSHRTCGIYATLISWCWEGLYAQSRYDYRILLEQLHSYFADWGVNGRATPEGIRLFGMFSSYDEAALTSLFQDVAHVPEPIIDMTNFENAGTLLYPVFKNFFQHSPHSRWLVNTVSREQMLEAGIPECAMISNTDIVE